MRWDINNSRAKPSCQDLGNFLFIPMDSSKYSSSPCDKMFDLDSCILGLNNLLAQNDSGVGISKRINYGQDLLNSYNDLSGSPHS